MHVHTCVYTWPAPASARLARRTQRSHRAWRHSAGKLYPNDWYRLHRAVVVAMQGGETQPEGATAEERELDAFRASLDVRAFFLCAPRLPLCERIDARCCQMLEGGLLEEVTTPLLHPLSCCTPLPDHGAASCNPTYPGCNPTYPGCNPTYPGDGAAAAAAAAAQ